MTKRKGPPRPPTYNELYQTLESILWASDTMVQGEMYEKFKEALVLLYGEPIEVKR